MDERFGGLPPDDPEPMQQDAAQPAHPAAKGSKAPVVCAIVALVAGLAAGCLLLLYFVLSKVTGESFSSGTAGAFLLLGALLSLIGFIVAIVALAQARRAARRGLVFGLAIPALLISLVVGLVYAVMAFIIGIILYACSHIEISGGDAILPAVAHALRTIFRV